MQSKAETVEQYLAELPFDRRVALQAVRRVFLDNIDSEIEESMQYGMIGYAIPHRVFPAGYHCDPSKPVGYGGIASQKQHMSLYLMSMYGMGAAGGPENEHGRWFREAWLKSGKKLDMGKACVRFKRIEDVALDVLAEAIRRVPSKVYLASYVRALEENKKAAAERGAAQAGGRAKGSASAGASSAAGATSGKAPGARGAGGSGAGGGAEAGSKGASSGAGSKPAARKVGSLGTAGGAPGGPSGGMSGTGGGASKGAKFGGAGQMPVKQSGPSKATSQRAGPSLIRKAPRSRSR